MIHRVGTGPQNRLSSDSPRLSPIMNQCPGGTLICWGKLHLGSPVMHGLMYESASRLPLRMTCPSTIEIESPGPATMRLMKFTPASDATGASHATDPSATTCGIGPHLAAPPPEVSWASVGGWHTTRAPTCR